MNNNKLGDLGFAAINHELLKPDVYIETLNVAYNGIKEIRLYVPLEVGSDRIYSVSNLYLDGNVFKSYTKHKLAGLLTQAAPLTSISFMKCKLEDDGLIIMFEAISTLRRVKKIDFSYNNIFDKGIKGICNYIGSSVKSVIQTIKFNNNEISDRGFRRLFTAIEKNVNTITELSFVENDLSDDGAFFLYNWLKQIRLRDVPHNLNLVQCDLSLNKIMHKTVREVET